MATGSGSSRTVSLAARAFQEVGGWLLILFGLMLALTALDTLSGGLVVGALFQVVGVLLFVLSGAAIAPSVRKRIDNRHSLSAFGRTPVVKSRSIPPGERCVERCVVCNAGIDAGMVRRYREDIVVAGVPLVFGSHSHNHYCLDCAREELGLTDPAEAVDGDLQRESTDERELETESA